MRVPLKAAEFGSDLTGCIDRALETLKEFFRRPQKELLKLHVDNSQGVKGYLSYQFEDGSIRRASYSLGRDYTNPEQHFVNVAAPGTMPINQWPDEDMPEFRRVIYEYCASRSAPLRIPIRKYTDTDFLDQEVFKFARKLLQIFALALGLEETALDEIFRQPLTDITMQYYPIQSPSEQSSISPHADYGGFTLLCQGQPLPLLFFGDTKLT